MVLEGTPQCTLPKNAQQFISKGWHLEYTYDRWSNATLAAKHYDVINAYLDGERQRLGRLSAKGLCVQDNWGPQKGPKFRQTVKENNPKVIPVQLWPGTTGQYPIVDLAGNHPFKNWTRRSAEAYVHTQACAQLRAGVQPSAVAIDLKMSTIKPKLLY